MIKVRKAKKHLSEMLADAGVNMKQPSVLSVWDVFKSFSEVEVDCAGDALLFQAGVFNFTGEDLFYLDFVRQFVIESNGEYDHMEQLHCEFLFKPEEKLRELKINLWSYDCASFADFFGKVEQLREFQVPVAEHVPLKLNVEQEEV